MRHISRLKSFFWYTSVALLVLLALLVTVARLSISHVSEYRDHLQQLAGDYLGQPVTISTMDARFVGLKPTIVLGNVSLREVGDNDPLAQFEQIDIALSPFGSIRQLAPVIELTVRGANIVVIQQEDGSFRLQGKAMAKQSVEPEEGSTLGEWFLSQSRLAIEQSRITWRSHRTGRDVVFDGVNIELDNQSSRHRLNARLVLPDAESSRLKLALELTGDPFISSDWQAELYLRTVNLEPAPWLEGVEFKEMQLKGGRVDMEVWSRWEAGRLLGLEGNLDLSQLEMLLGEDALPVRHLAAGVNYRQESEGWYLALNDARVGGDDGDSAPFQLQLRQREQQSFIRLRQLELGRIATMVQQLPMLSDEHRSILEQVAPSGHIESLRADIKDKKLRRLQASVRATAIKPWQKLPGFEGLDASLRFDGEHLALDVDSPDLQISLPRLFDKPLALQHLKGQVLAERRGGGWNVVTRGLESSGETIQLQASAALQVRPGEAPLVDLAARFSKGNITAVPDYLPVKIMPEATTRWLNRAFAAGAIDQGELLIHGRLEKSLLREEQGKFAVRLDAKSVSLDYSPGWPKLDAIDGEVRFSGRGMAADIRAGRLFRSPLRPTYVTIENFRQAQLKLNGSVNASTADALRFLHQSPLVDDADELLAQVEADGAAPVTLKMALPLSQKIKDSAPLKIDGTVAFRDALLRLPDKVEVGKLQGDLKFTEKELTAHELAAQMYGHPAIVNVFSEEGADGKLGKTVIAAHGVASASELLEGYSLPMLERLDGQSDWQASVTLDRANGGGSRVDLHSSLKGMSVKLPEPLGKEQDAAQPLSFTLALSGAEKGSYRLNYAEKLDLVWRLNEKSSALDRLALHWGHGEARLPEEPLIHIGGDLRRFDLDGWSDIWRKLSTRQGKQDTGSPSLPLRLRMQRFHFLPRSDKEHAVSDKAVSEWPALDVKIGDFAYGDYKLGEVILRAEPTARTVNFNKISAKTKHFTLLGRGQSREGGNSRFKLHLTSDNMGKMLEGLGFASVIKDGKMDLGAQLSWPGPPTGFSLRTLQAEGHLKVEEGVISDVEPGAGKLLGLLSLQALPRRLLLDFSDVADKGLQFTSIEGDIKIEQGDITTDDLLVKSLPADILVSGRTGLVERDYDQLVMVVPNVSDTVSVAGALAWGPQVAAALIVLQKVFKRGIDAATMTRYKVTGSWDNPEITELEPLPLQEENDEE